MWQSSVTIDRVISEVRREKEKKTDQQQNSMDGSHHCCWVAIMNFLKLK